MSSAGPPTSLDFVLEPLRLNSEGTFQGPVGNLLKKLAQTMFYSCAMENIEDVFLPNATLGDVYSALQWDNYI